MAPEKPPFDLEQADTLLTTTRAVRRRLDLDRPVQRKIIEQCLEIALQAPTGSNRQGWQWIVVTAPETRGELAKLYRRGAGDYLAQARAEAEAKGEAQNERVFSSAEYLAENLERVPVHLVPCIHNRLGKNDNPHAWSGLFGSIYPAIWSLQLALRARGLGSCITTLHLRHAPEAAALLGVPDDYVQVGLIPIAYTQGTDFKPARRNPLADVLHWDRFAS